MTTVIVDLKAINRTHVPGDQVTIWAPALRAGLDGHLVSTAPEELSPPVTLDLEPGPLVVQVSCAGWADTTEREVTVPDAGPVTLWTLLEGAHP